MSVSANVLKVFGFDTSLVSVKPLGEGLINHTYIVDAESASYVLQKINTAVFKNPGAIAHNIKWVSDYLAANNPAYYFVAPIPSVHGNQMEYIEEGYYRKDLNIDIISKFRLETVFIPFNLHLFPLNKFNSIEVHTQLMEHFVYGLMTVKGHELMNQYKKLSNQAI